MEPLDVEIPGVTAVDPALLAAAAAPRKVKRTFGSLLVGDDNEIPPPSEAEMPALAPPDAEVRREILRLEMDARLVALKAERAGRVEGRRWCGRERSAGRVARVNGGRRCARRGHGSASRQRRRSPGSRATWPDAAPVSFPGCRPASPRPPPRSSVSTRFASATCACAPAWIGRPRSRAGGWPSSGSPTTRGSCPADWWRLSPDPPRILRTLDSDRSSRAACPASSWRTTSASSCASACRCRPMRPITPGPPPWSSSWRSGGSRPGPRP